MARKYYIPSKVLPKLTNTAKRYHIVSCFLAQKGDRMNTARLANQLKNLGNYSLAKDAFDELFRCSPITERAVWGNSCPKEIAALGNGDNSYYFKPKSLENEVSWSIFGLRRFRKQIRDFVILRDQIEKHILLGDYDDACQLLEQSVKLFGYSVWYYEMRLTISGIQGRVDECYNMYSQVNEEYKNADRLHIVPILIQNLGNRSLSKTPLRYDNMVVSTFKRNQDKGSRLDYYLFRLNYYQYYDLDCLSEVVEMENIQSAVDRYTMLLYVFRSCYITKPDQRDMILKLAQQLYRISEDKQVLPFLALNNGASVPDSYYDADFIAILDNYYTGNYENTAKLCCDYLERDPSNLYVVKLYCRSLMFIKKGFQFVTHNNESLLYTIAFNTYKVMSEKENTQYLEKLNSLLKNIYGLRIAASLDRFVKTEQREPHEDLLDYLTMTQFDPFFIKVYEKEEEQKAYLERGLQYITGSAAIEYRKQCVERCIAQDSPVVAYIRDVDTAKITYERELYLDALDQWQIIFAATHDSIPTAQTAVEYVFRSLVSLGPEKRQEAVKFYVDCFIENRSFVSKVDTFQFMIDIKQSRYEGLRNDIDLMLFVFLNADKYPQKQFVLERCCKYERVTYPSELIQRLCRKGDPHKVELFFSILLNDDILYHHYKLRSTIDVLDEKLKIVNYLKATYPEKSKYADIYTELMHEIIAYRSMAKLDDSKIYVNEDAVMKYELCDIEPLYDRLCKQAALARGDSKLIVVGTYNLEDPDGLTEILKDTASYSTDAVADVAVELYGIIRLAFLKSRFGLGTYLSTRIRHGVFEGEMRSFLEKLDLILSTDGGSYVPNSHWPREYQLEPASRDILNKALIKFSQSTDDLISSFKDSVIQIRVDKNDKNEGLFCYEQPSEVVSQKFLQFEGETKNADEFCRKVIDWLWEITEQCLVLVREKVQTVLKPSFTNNISQLEKNLEQIHSHATFRADMHNAINNAREELTTRIAKVENWFYRQEAKPEHFHITNHINMALDTIRNYSPDVNMKADGKAPSPEPLFHANYSASMFDLLTIFLSNVFKYSRVEMERPLLFDVLMEDGDMMHWHIENNLPENTDEDALNKDLQSRLSNEKLIQKEGGSGLAKAMNIVKYDFGNENNTYTIVASEGKCITDVYVNLANMVVTESIHINSQY